MPQIKQLSDVELAAWMDDVREPRLIEFYASWCIYHFLTSRKLERLQTALGTNVQVGRIDSVGNEDCFRGYGITQIPTIGYFHADRRITWVGDTDLNIMLEEIQQTELTGEQHV